MKRVEVDTRGRVTLGAGFTPGTYLASVTPDGSFILQPAVVMTQSEIAALTKGDES